MLGIIKLMYSRWFKKVSLQLLGIMINVKRRRNYFCAAVSIKQLSLLHILKSLQPEGENLLYFKLRLFEVQ